MQLINFEKEDNFKKKVTVIGIFILTIMLIFTLTTGIYEGIKTDENPIKIIFIGVVFLLLSLVVFKLKISRWLILIIVYYMLVSKLLSTIYVIFFNEFLLNNLIDNADLEFIILFIINSITLFLTIYLLSNNEALKLFYNNSKTHIGDAIVIIIGVTIGIYTSWNFISNSIEVEKIQRDFNLSKSIRS